MSYAERLMAMPVKYPKKLVSDYEVRGTEQVVENGRVVKKSVMKTVHPQDNFKGIECLDFALENVIAAGALDSLKECQLNGNTLGIADNVEGSIDNIIDAVDEAEMNVEPQNNEGE